MAVATRLCFFLASMSASEILFILGGSGAASTSCFRAMGIGIILGFGFVRLNGFGTVHCFTGCTESSCSGCEAEAFNLGSLAFETASSFWSCYVDRDIDMPTLPVAFRSI